MRILADEDPEAEFDFAEASTQFLRSRKNRVGVSASDFDSGHASGCGDIPLGKRRESPVAHRQFDKAESLGAAGGVRVGPNLSDRSSCPPYLFQMGIRGRGYGGANIWNAPDICTAPEQYSSPSVVPHIDLYASISHGRKEGIYSALPYDPSDYTGNHTPYNRSMNAPRPCTGIGSSALYLPDLAYAHKIRDGHSADISMQASPAYEPSNIQSAVHEGYPKYDFNIQHGLHRYPVFSQGHSSNWSTPMNYQHPEDPIDLSNVRSMLGDGSGRAPSKSPVSTHQGPRKDSDFGLHQYQSKSNLFHDKDIDPENMHVPTSSMYTRKLTADKKRGDTARTMSRPSYSKIAESSLHLHNVPQHPSNTTSTRKSPYPPIDAHGKHFNAPKSFTEPPQVYTNTWGIPMGYQRSEDSASLSDVGLVHEDGPSRASGEVPISPRQGSHKNSKFETHQSQFKGSSSHNKGANPRNKHISASSSHIRILTADKDQEGGPVRTIDHPPYPKAIGCSSRARIPRNSDDITSARGSPHSSTNTHWGIPNAPKPFTEYVKDDQGLIDKPLEDPRAYPHPRREHSDKSIMTSKDIEYITRMQIFQLFSDSPYRDDYYCKMYGSNTGKIPVSHREVLGRSQNSRLNWQQSLLLSSKCGNSDNRSPEVSALMRLQSIIDDFSHRKSGQSENQKNPQGPQIRALGDGLLSKATYKNPRKLILVKENVITALPEHLAERASPAYGTENSDSSRELLSQKKSSKSLRDQHKSCLVTVEKAYDIVLKIETLKLKNGSANNDGYISRFKKLLCSSDDPRILLLSAHTRVRIPNATDVNRQFSSGDIGQLIDELVVYLGFDNPSAPIQPTHRLPQILNTSKGIRLYPRLLDSIYLNNALITICIIGKYADRLNVLNGNHTQDEINMFLTWALPSISALMCILPLRNIAIFVLELAKRWVPSDPEGSKPGLALFTLALYRVKALKSEPRMLEESDLKCWNVAYERLFRLSRTLTNRVFHSKPNGTSRRNLDYSDEDFYAWRFFMTLFDGSSHSPFCAAKFRFCA